MSTEPYVRTLHTQAKTRTINTHKFVIKHPPTKYIHTHTCMHIHTHTHTIHSYFNYEVAIFVQLFVPMGPFEVKRIKKKHTCQKC